MLVSATPRALGTGRGDLRGHGVLGEQTDSAKNLPTRHFFIASCRIVAKAFWGWRASSSGSETATSVIVVFMAESRRDMIKITAISGNGVTGPQTNLSACAK
ncbi:MAG: hypothetical protein IT494_02360 [Gammaproteobacteria bacterium]|nr:hypothetical protein [Gammaproteobacteria bacterium]